MSDPTVTAMGIIGNQELTEELLMDTLSKLGLVFPGIDLEPTRRLLEAKIGLSLSPGVGLTNGENEPWVDDVKAAIDWVYWDSYVKQLQSQGFTNAILGPLDVDTDNVLTECGNPATNGEWRIQGLVMGDVQSGKTANYCGLVTKAADAGYKVIVLLTGMIEELRSQSQERMDEGFVGQDSNGIIEGVRGRFFGAGRFRNRSPNVLTSVSSDFLTANERSLRGIPLQNLGEPLLLVMKKNSTPLKRLIEFLKRQLHNGGGQLDMPLLLVDDEADNASVNTKGDENPARINSQIRELLALFRRASYVGYTATPFANVFINPDSEWKDLFPANFIYSLKAPSNYIGAASIFADDGQYAGQLQEIDDACQFFPEKHKKTLEVEALPPSMEKAIGVFLISCAIRDLRAEPLRHRSMLINVTRFTDVQARLATVVQSHLFALQSEIKQYMAADEIWSRHQTLVRLHQLYLENYAECGVEWDQIRKHLYDAVATVKVLTINQKTESENKLNYRQYRGSEKGRRVIAIGGLTLSRGLTLEGLCVSYFYRNSKAYDTLLQMGRWFGYRPGYVDLCRLWMSGEAQDWFGHIAEVVAELRSDIRHMHLNRLPPKDFGIRVRSHPDLLLVTARDKMRNSDEVEVNATFSTRGIETANLPRSRDINDANVKVTADFLERLGTAEALGTRYLWREVDALDIASYLDTLSISPMNTAFMKQDHTGEQPLISFIRFNEIAALRKWDVCIAQGNGEMAQGITISSPSSTGIQVKKRRRQFERPRDVTSRTLKSNKQRIGDSSDEKVGLTEAAIREAEAAWKKEPKNEGKSVPGSEYRKVRDRPLLTISPIQPADPANPDGKNASRIMPSTEIEPDLLIAVSLSFPRYTETEQTSVTYRINKVYLRNMGMLDEEDEGQDEDID